MKQNKFWLKLIGVVLLIHVSLILLSVIEVTIYSYLANPGQAEEVYNAHATQSAPWISYIFGSLFMFLLVRKFMQRFSHQQLTYAIALPLLYGITDILIVIAAGMDLKEAASQLIIGKLLKFAAALLAYVIYSRKATGRP
jgi:hypothetical protein